MKVLNIFPGIILALASALFFTSCTGDNKALAEDTKQDAVTENISKDSSACKELDSKFLINAAEIHLMQIQLAQLAHTKSKNPSVLEMSKSMEDIYTGYLNELTRVAEIKNITLPVSTTKEGQAAYDKLNEQDRKEFDKAYGIMVVDTHTAAIDTLKQDSCCDPTLKAWNKKVLFDMQRHLDMAVEFQKQF